MVRGPVNKLRSLHRGRKGSVWNTERGHKIGVGFLFRGGSGGTWCTGLKEAGGATNRGKRTSLRMTRARSNDDERNCSQHWHERKKKKNHFLIFLFFQNSRYSRFIYRWLEFTIYTYERFFFTPFFLKHIILSSRSIRSILKLEIYRGGRKGSKMIEIPGNRFVKNYFPPSPSPSLVK